MKKKINNFAKLIIETPLIKERQFKYLIISSFGVVIVNFLYIIFSVSPKSKIFPIRYNFLYEITRTGEAWSLLFMPFLAIVLIVGNTVIAHHFYNKDRLVTYIFLSVNILFAIMVFLETISLINMGQL